jgi:hypothetical protein
MAGFRASLVLLILFVGAAHVAAQDLGTVTFSPTIQQVYDAASGNPPGRIAPDPSSSAIVIPVNHWRFARVSVEIDSPVPFQLIADYSSSARGVRPELTLSTSQQDVYHGVLVNQSQIDVSYWLQLTGPVAAGTYNVTVTYVVGGRPQGGGTIYTNHIEVVVPPIMATRISGGDAVSFDYGARPQAYFDAAHSGGTLPPTGPGTTLTSVDVWSSTTYDLMAAIVAAGQGQALQTGVISLKGVPLTASPSAVATGDATGGEFIPVITPPDFALSANEVDLPGTYDYVVTYTLASP